MSLLITSLIIFLVTENASLLHGDTGSMFYAGIGWVGRDMSKKLTGISQ